jgi:hypothetical protein
MDADRPDDVVALDPYTGQPYDPRAAAAEGAALLDRLPLPGWREQIDPARLDMSDGHYHGKVECKGCIGAQLDHRHLQAVFGVPEGEACGEYSGFVYVNLPTVGDMPGVGVDFTVHYGFRAPDVGDLVEETRMYEALTDAWRQILTA